EGQRRKQPLPLQAQARGRCDTPSQRQGEAALPVAAKPARPLQADQEDAGTLRPPDLAEGPWHAPLEAALPPSTASRPPSGPGAGDGCGRREDGPREGPEAVQGPLRL